MNSPAGGGNGATGTLRGILSKLLPGDLSYFTSGFLYMGATLLLKVALGALSVYFQANILGRAGYGTLGFLAGFMGLATIFTIPAVGQAISFSVAKGKEGAFVKGTRWRLAGSIIASIILFFGAVYYWFYRDDPVLGGVFLISGIFFPLTKALDNFDSYLRARKDFQQYFRRRTFLSFAGTAITIGSVLYFREVYGLLACRYAFIALVNIGFYVFIVRRLENLEVDENFSSISKRFSALSILTVAASSLEPILIGTYVSLAALGAYNLVIAASKYLRYLAALVNKVFFPKLAEARDRHRYAGKVLFVAFLLSFAGVAGYLVFVPLLSWVIGTFFPAYRESLDYVPWVLATAILTLPNLACASYMVATADLHPLYVGSQWIRQIMALIGILTLTGLLGVWGIIYTRLAIEVFQYFFYVVTLTGIILKKSGGRAEA